MAQFNEAFKITMDNEGGYSKNPADSGGETYKGITRNYWPNWQGWPVIDRAIATKPVGINQLLLANAALQTMVTDFYKTNYWDKESLDNINDQQIANQIFDAAVNMGTGTAARFLQQAINKLNPNTLTIDGTVGPLTIAAANSANAEDLYNAINKLRTARYKAIIKNNPTQQQFAKSWLGRIAPYQG